MNLAAISKVETYSLSVTAPCRGSVIDVHMQVTGDAAGIDHRATWLRVPAQPWVTLIALMVLADCNYIFN